MAQEWSSIGSLFATFFFIRSLIFELLPPSFLLFVRNAVSDGLLFWFREMTILIEEFDYHGYSETFDNALRYLSDRVGDTASVVKVTDSSTSRGYSFNVDINQTLHDQLDGIKVRWRLRVRDSGALGRSGSNRVRYLELSFSKSLNHQVRNIYFPKILSIGHEQDTLQRARKLYTNSSSGERGSLWSSVSFDHPSTFDTLAIDPALKSTLMRDLKAFASKESYYRRVGKTWKRGYLIYGPPGTGKTSLVAAMANYLEFDVYDLELSAVVSNSQLRKLLLETRRRSLIVIEDIDRSVPLCNDFARRSSAKRANPADEDDVEDAPEEGTGWRRGGELSLSGILNFMDGLWSCCGQERIMVVTTNNRDKLDPALLRPGRLDVHINLSYCGVPALRTLAANYLPPAGKLVGGPRWAEAEDLLPKVKVTPATVAEVLIGSETPELALSNLTELLRKEQEKARCGGEAGLNIPALSGTKHDDDDDEN